MKLLRALATATTGLLAVAGASAQADYPSKPIRLIVPFPAGGGLDSVARPLAAGLQKELGQMVLIENRAGGNLIPATQTLVSSPADGYTLMFTMGQPFTTNQYFYKKLNYDPKTSFTPIAPVAAFMLGVHVPANSPFKTLKDLIDHAKANPDKLNFATAGATTPGRLATEVFLDRAGVKVTHVPYQGSSPQVVGVIGNQADMMVADHTTTNQFLASGKLRELAVFNPKRLAAYPQVPTVGEAGYPDLDIPHPWTALVGPKGLPEPIVKKLAAAVTRVLESAEMKRFLNDTQMLSLEGGPEAVRDMIDRETRAFGPVIQRLGIQLD